MASGTVKTKRSLYQRKEKKEQTDKDRKIC